VTEMISVKTEDASQAIHRLRLIYR